MTTIQLPLLDEWLGSAARLVAFAVGGGIGFKGCALLAAWAARRTRRRNAEKEATHADRHAHNHAIIQALSHDCEQLKQTAASAVDTRAALGKRLKNRIHLLTQSRKEIMSLKGQVRDLTHQIQGVVSLGGKIWERAIQGAPVFQPMTARKTRIIALANLKGGVGKTTLAANLGATLWKQGYRVLLIDLDYQGSLTSLCLTGQEIEDLRRAGRFLHRLFQDGGDSPEALLQAITRIGDSDGFLLGADEELADVEMQAMAEWLLDRSGDEVRFRLRRLLHSPDVILLDCPPRLTTASVNALTCCDYVLIPVLLDLTSAEAVPRLLAWLRHLRQTGLCQNLRLAGVLGNRAHPRAELIQREAAIWEELPHKCADTWGEPVYHFRTVVRQSGRFADASRKAAFASFSSELEPVFLDLADELKVRTQLHESRRAASVR